MSEPLDLEGLIAESAAIDAVSGYVDGPEAFCPWVTPDGRSPQRDFVLGAKEFPRRLFQAGNRCGKSQPIDEPVMTPSGPRAIGDMRTGDEIYAGDGSTTQVVGVFPQGRLPVYRVTFNDGSWTRCSGDHLWRVMDRENRFPRPGRTGGRWDVLSLSEIVRRWGQRPARVQSVVIPPPPRQERPAIVLPLDPYLLGVLLGDGSLRGNMVGFSTADPEILASVSAAIPAGGIVRHTGAYDYAIRYGCNRKHPVLEAIRSLGLAGKLSYEKFVPPEYKAGSAEQRMEILRGLLDTDGSCSQRGQIEFCSTSKRLADDVSELALSLGGIVRRSPARTTHYTYKGERRAGRESWRVRIRMSPGVVPFRLARKAAHLTNAGRFEHYRVLRAVEPDGESECVCIAVDHPDRTYLTRFSVVTHNTYTGGFEVAAAALGMHPCFPFAPPLSIWVSALDRDFGVAQVAWPAIKRWIPPQEIASAAWHRREPESPLTIRLRNGSQIDFKTVDSGRQKYQGTGLHLVWTDEEHPADIMQEIRARLLDYGGRLNVTCTPLLRSAWLQDLTRDPKTLVVRASMLDAAHAGVINLQEVLDYAESLPERQRRVRVLGDFVAMEGAVYPSFSASTHVAKPRDGGLWVGNKRVCDYPIPGRWPRYAAADFGINHPMAVGRAAHDGKIGRLIVERCWYASGVRFSRWAEILKSELGGLAGPLICDRDAGGRAEFEAAGIETAPALKAIQAGIELVERLLEPRSDGLPGLVLVEDPALIHPTLGRCDARKVAVETGNYHYPENKEGKPLRADLPIKQDDDAVDMLRYLATTVSMWTRTGAPGRGQVDDGIGRRLKVDW